jgi:hypothetical protein
MVAVVAVDRRHLVAELAYLDKDSRAAAAARNHQRAEARAARVVARPPEPALVRLRPYWLFLGLATMAVAVAQPV